MNLTILCILLVGLISSVNCSSLLGTHFVKSVHTGFRNVNISSITLSIDFPEFTNELALLKKYEESAGKLAKLFNKNPFKGLTFEPMMSLSKQLSSSLQQVSYIINDTKDLLVNQTSFLRTKKSVGQTCQIKITVEQEDSDVLLETLQFGIAHITSELKNYGSNLTAFKESSTHFDTLNTLTAMDLQVNSFLRNLKTTRDNIFGIISNLITPTIARKLISKCLPKTVACNPVVKILQCAGTELHRTCTAIYEIGSNPTPVFELKPYIFDGCKITTVYLLDAQHRPYVHNGHFLEPRATDSCLNALRDLNITNIRANCELSQSSLKYERTNNGIIVFEITPELKDILKNKSVAYSTTPFEFLAGDLTFNLNGVPLTFDLTQITGTRTPILPFEKVLLCPNPLQTIFTQDWTTTVSEISITSLSTLILFVIINYCYNKLKCNNIRQNLRQRGANRNGNRNRRINESLMQMIERPRTRRT